MDSAPPTLSPAPAGFSVVSPNSSFSSSSYDTDDEDVHQGFINPRFNRSVIPPDFNLRGNASMAGADLSVSCFSVVFVCWFFVSLTLIVGVYGPKTVWIGPNASMLVEPNPLFVQSIQVKELDDSKSGLQLFGFYKSPPLDVVVNWSDSRSESVSHKSYKGWPYYLNEGASLNISYTVKPEGYSAWLVVDKGMASHWLLEKPESEEHPLSLNLVRGSGMIQAKISKSASYHVAVANPNLKEVEVELSINVGALVYDTKESFYKCTFSNGECTFNAMSFAGHSVVLTSPAPKGILFEEEEWYIRLSYQPRWTSYVIFTGFVTCFMLAAIQLWNKLPCAGGERYVMENDSARTHLLANKDDDGSSMCSSTEAFAGDDADLEDFIGTEGEASNGTRRLCAICFDAQRDSFFLPCGHCVSCYECGTKIAEADGSCPICRRKMKKVKRIYTV